MAHTYDSIQIGDSFTFTRLLTAEDVQVFADLTGDDNPIHVDEEYAKQTRFGKPIVHGILALGIISKVLGRDFPGPGSIAVDISCRFLRPIPVGSEVTIEVKISKKIEARRHVKGKVYAYVDGRMAIGGEATIMPPTSDAAEDLGA